MSINHVAEAQRCLSKASWMRGDGPDAQFVDPMKAAVLASLAQAHATLAQLPEEMVVAQEQLADAERDLAATQQIVGNFIVSALIDEPQVARPASILARALRSRGLSVDDQIAARMKDRGLSYDPDVEIAINEEKSTPAREGELLEAALGVVVEHLLRMSTSWEPVLRSQAVALMRDLDEAGVNIDRRVDEASEERGHGPTLCDMLGHRYDLTKQWVDRRGKLWEHTGSWSDVGGPIMRRDEPDGDSLVLSDLVREYGPLRTLTVPPKAPAVEADCPF